MIDPDKKLDVVAPVGQATNEKPKYKTQLIEILDSLIQADLISPQEREIIMNKATVRQLNEFLLRKKRREQWDDPIQREDIVKSFSLAGRQGELPVKLLKAELYARSKLLIKSLQEAGFRVVGVIYFGSRLNPNKQPRPDSDLDMRVIVDSMPRSINELARENRTIESKVKQFMDSPNGLKAFIKERRVETEVLGGIAESLDRPKKIETTFYADEVQIVGAKPGDVDIIADKLEVKSSEDDKELINSL